MDAKSSILQKKTLKRNSSDLTLAEVTANNIDNIERLISAHGVLHISMLYAYLISVPRLTFIQNEKHRRGEGKVLVNLITMEVTSQGLFTFPYVSFHCFLHGEDFENEGGRGGKWNCALTLLQKDSVIDILLGN